MSIAGYFLARRPETPDPLPSGASLERVLEDARERGLRAWPGVALEPGAFAAHLAECLPQGADLQEWLGRADVEGLYLACGCADHVPEALLAFERQILSQVPLFLARLAQPEAFVEEVLQLLRVRLFVGERPRIAEFRGQGRVGGWVRVVAVRAGLELLRRQGRWPEAAADAEDKALTLGDDPELAYLKERSRGPFQDALRAAMAALSSEERNLLRLHFVDQQSIDRLAELFRIHRSTAARRLQQVRERVLTQVRQTLREQMRMGESELDGLWGLLSDELDLSIGTLLRSARSAST